VRFRPLPAGTQPPFDAPAYRSTHKRAPRHPLVTVEPTLEATGPKVELPALDIATGAMGERIVVAGRVTDDGARPVAGAVIELWQANAAGRYHHASDTHDAPLDPNFRGVGRVITDDDGNYRFVTIKPGAYPWGNHDNAWRPAHIHFSLFGATWGSRLVTQMYFPGDPLLAIDPIFQAVPDEAARERLVSRFDLALTRPAWALGYRFDIVLRGTPFE
jgi:protocatechuate 3,4-dioxygenase beta subunit